MYTNSCVCVFVSSVAYISTHEQLKEADVKATLNASVHDIFISSANEFPLHFLFLRVSICVCFFLVFFFISCIVGWLYIKFFIFTFPIAFSRSVSYLMRQKAKQRRRNEAALCAWRVGQEGNVLSVLIPHNGRTKSYHLLVWSGFYDVIALHWHFLLLLYHN